MSRSLDTMTTLTALPVGEPNGVSVLAGWPRAIAPAVLRRQGQVARFDLDVLPHLEAAVDWILAAHRNSQDGGISAYYDLLRRRWRQSYPETTGYTIPTLFEAARRLRRPELADVAVRLADYLLQVRTPEGGVGHWDHRSGEAVDPIVFDTGQVIFGWLAAWQETGAAVYLECAVKAARWLVSIQSPSGAWYRYQHLDTVKVIDARVAWSLLAVAHAAELPELVEAARSNLDWACGLQLSNGWFRHAGFRPGQDPFTHTIAYTAEGLLESGLLLEEPNYVAAAEKVARVMLDKQQPDGSLASTYDENWEPTASSSCLTGDCQMGLLWMRMFECTREYAFVQAAHRAVAFVARTQDLSTSNPCIRGGIGGSLPLYGPYERMKYPNWAAKFFVDALLLLEKVDVRLMRAAPGL